MMANHVDVYLFLNVNNMGFQYDVVQNKLLVVFVIILHKQKKMSVPQSININEIYHRFPQNVY